MYVAIYLFTLWSFIVAGLVNLKIFLFLIVKKILQIKLNFLSTIISLLPY